MRVLRVCLFFLAAAVFHPSLHAATRSTTRRLTVTPVALHRTSAVLLHRLSFPDRYPRALNLPAEPVQSSVDPSSPSHAFSLISFAVHSVLGLFRHSPA